MSLPRILLLFLAAAGLGACRSSKTLEKPAEFYEDDLEVPVSTINIPISVQVDELESSLNRQLGKVLYEDNSYEGDQMMLRAVRQGDIGIAMDSQQINYRLPLILWIKYNAGITEVEANGEIILNMKTAFGFQPDWKLVTKTDLIGHQWVREPKLRVGVVNLPVGAVLNVVLRQGRSYLTRYLDDLVRQNFRMDEIVRQTWRQMFEPLLVSEQYNTWLMVNPRAIGLTPLVANGSTVSATVVVESQPAVKVGARPQGRISPPLPPLARIGQTNEDFVINLNTEISYEEAERLARAQLVGETFSSGKKSVTVQDIEIYGSGKNLVVNTRLTGSYTGSIYLEGEPYYDRQRNTIQVRDLKFTLDTENFLYKSAGWLLKSTIKRKIQENLEFLLDYNLEDMKNQFQQQLRNYKITEGVTLDGQLRELSIQRVYLTPQSMMVNIGLTGDVDLMVRGLN